MIDNRATELPHRSTDAAYSDPIGEAVQRPKTAAIRHDEDEDHWGDDAADMLPE
jgi:hypothetical protein